VTHQIGLSVLDGVGYGLDSMGRRTSITRPGGQNDSYGYDAAGQVTAGSYLATPSGNQSDGFAYDGMGNRTTSARNGVNVSYSANALEQYSAVGGAVPTYDAGGNTLSLPVPGSVTVGMTWDAENRMLSSTRNGAAVGATVLPLASSLVNGARVVNRYDVLHRRVVKEVHAPNGSGGWTLQERRLFTYDGWNVIEERAFDAGGSPLSWQRLTWGRDASGRLQGAGGVGGLLLAEELPVSGVGGAVGHYPGYDGNGNVVLMTTGSGVVEGRWRYGAFGGTLGSVTASGGYAERQAWRFSGKYLDGEVETLGGVYYYGYRHYVPEVGRWVGRDPIGEKGGVNLYEMVGNWVVNHIDRLGLALVEGPPLTGLPPGTGGTRDSSSPGGGAGYEAGDYAPSRKGENKVNRDRKTCEVWIESSVTYTVTISQGFGDLEGFATADGEAAIRAHEGRRREVYEKGFNSYLKGFEDLTGKCRQKFDSTTACQRAEKKLSTWLKDLHVGAVDKYQRYVSSQQKLIGDENKSANLNWGYDSNRADGLLFDGFVKVHTVVEPEDDTDFSCPSL
jgi:RHS repeat-associated protein